MATSSKKSQSTDSGQSFIDVLNSRLRLAKKFGEKQHKEIKKWLKDYNIESLEGLDDTDLHNQMQIPYIFSTIESGLPTMFETMPSIVMQQRGKEDLDFTEFIEPVWQYVADKVNLEEKIESGGTMFLIAGNMQFKYGWETETEMVDQEEQIPITDANGQQVDTHTVTKQIEVPVKDQPFLRHMSYKRVFFSPESEFVVDDEENLIPYIVCQENMSPEQIKDIYHVDVETDTTMNLSDIHDDLKADDPEVVKSDIIRQDVYEYYGVIPKEYSNDKNWKYNKVYFVPFIKSKVLAEPTLMKKKPLVLQKNYGTPEKFWGFGEPKALRKLEQDISLGRSKIADQRDRQDTKIAIPQGTEVDEDALKSPKKFQIIRYMGQQPPSYVNPPQVSESTLTALDQSRQDIQMASAQLDISRGGNSNTVKTATGQQIFQQATEKRINRKRKKIAHLIEAIATNLLVMCAEHWDANMFGKITDTDPQEIEQNGYIEKLKALGEEFDIHIEVESININKSTRAAQMIALYDKVKDDPYIRHEEVLKKALEYGFDVKDFDRFMKTPQEVAQAQATASAPPPPHVNVSIKADAAPGDGDRILQSSGLLPAPQPLQNPDQSGQSQMATGMPEMMGDQGNAPGAGRPAVADPTQVAQDSMPGASEMQINAQTQAAPQQMGIPKIQGG